MTNQEDEPGENGTGPEVYGSGVVNRESSLRHRSLSGEFPGGGTGGSRTVGVDVIR